MARKWPNKAKKFRPRLDVSPLIHHLVALFLIISQQYHNVFASQQQQPSTYLLFTTYHDIRMANLSRPNSPSIEIVTKDLQEAGALDIHYEKQMVCWADHTLMAIECMKMNGSDAFKPSKLIHNLDKPDGLAIDWYTDKLYWTDGETDRIEVASLDGKHQKVLIWTDLDQPRAIALVPSKRYMIWSDWGDNPKIERASMDGDPSSRKVLVSEKLNWPNGLAIDIEKELIYWVDGKDNFLDVMNLDGGNRRTLVTNLKYPYSVTYTSNRLFWTDWDGGSLLSYDIATNELKQILESASPPIGVHAWDQKVQPPGDSACKHNNGNCSHLCLLSSTNAAGYTCACPTGIKLLTNNQCADGPKSMLLVVQRHQISKISLDSPDHTAFVLPFGRKQIRYAIAIDYDPVEDMVYWSDEIFQAIQRGRQDGSGLMTVVSTEVGQPDGIALDLLARNLYWTDAETDRIEVCRLDGSFRKVLINTDLTQPRAIAVAPQLGWMFWSDWDSKKPKVERASLDGTERVTLVSAELGWPNGIALDIEAKKVYWCDAKLDKIEVVNMDGTDRTVIINENLPHPFGLTLMGDYLYWTDWIRRSIDGAHKGTGLDRKVIADQVPEVMGLVGTRLHKNKGSNPCAVKNGGCNQLCLNRPKDYVCRCHIDYELSMDKKTCVIPEAFLLFSKQDTIGRMSTDFNAENHHENIPYKDIRDAHYLDIDIRERRVYWTDQKAKCISGAFVNGSDVHKVIDSGLMQPDGVAIDWISRNIYWTDSEARRIEVARLDGTSRRTLIWKGIEEPGNLIVEPQKGYMYWSEWASDTIRRAAMDGSELTTVIAGANHATGLTLDPSTRRLYWARQSEQTAIEWADWDGKRREKLVFRSADDSFAPHAVTVYNEYVYWSDRSSETIERVHKISGKDRRLIHKDLDYVSSLTVFHKSRQTGTNNCEIDNGGCSHLCLPLPGSRKSTCACPTHYQLAGDGTSCIPPRNYLIFSQKNAFGRLLPNTSDAPDTPFPIMAKNIRAIEYDPNLHFIYWIDGRSSSIRRAHENGTKPESFVPTGSQPFDLAVDVIGRHLYWTCSRANSINITKLTDGQSIGNAEIGDTEKPRNLAIHTVRRLLFWTDVGVQQAVFRARLDGSECVTLASKLEGVAALTVDHDKDLIFYAHGKRIDVMDLNGKSRRNLVQSHLNQVISLAAFQGLIYWLDDKTGVERVSVSGENRRPELQRLVAITDVVSVWSPEPKRLKNLTCSRSKCSHLCIASSDTKEETCGCPQGLMLMKDKKNCGALPVCGADHFTCALGGFSGDLNKDCIPMSWRCDGQNDCPDKSDEMDCPTCRPDQFRCRSGECIDQKRVCDGVSNCSDGDDEASCCKQPTDFQCPGNGVCISRKHLCDGWDQCADGADETPEICALTLEPNSYSSSSVLFTVLLCGIVGIGFVIMVTKICRTKLTSKITEPKEDPAALAPLTETTKNGHITLFPTRGETIGLRSLGERTINSYDRNHITGASSSTTNGSSLNGYPAPPPSPATIGSVYKSYNHPYKHYKTINQPPPPTPCSSEVCDESDSNYTSKSGKSYRSIKQKYHHHHHRNNRFESEPDPPPPTPRSHYHYPHGSCPPSPSSRSSTDFRYQPPPPSPVH